MRFSFLVLTFAVVLSGCAPGGNPPITKPHAAITFVDFARVDAVPATTPDCGGSCQALRQEFRYVIYVGKQVYCYWDEKKADTGTDFDAFAATLEQSITNSTNLTAYYQILRRWASAFHDGHVNAMMKPDTSDIDLYTAPFRLEVLAPGTDHETVVVVESATPELAVGEQVLAINGVPVAKAIDAAEQIASGSTRRMRRWASARRLVDALGVEAGSQDLILTLKDRAVSLGRTVALTPRPGANSSASAIDPTGADLLKATVFPGGIGYLRIDGFSGSQMPFLLDAALDRLAGTQGLILDLRKNGGGDQSGNRILARLAAQNITRYRTSERLSQFVLSQRPEIFGLFQQSPDAPFALWHDLTVRAATDRRYAGKVFALTSPNCFSACDTFTSALKTNGLATVIGESTGGGTGTPLVFELPNSGMSFRYSVVRGHTAKDETIEGAGTLVDIALEPTLEERAARKDAQLLTTIALLKQALSGSEQPHPVPAAVESAVRALAPIWSQDLAIAPTWSDEAALQRLAPVDERE